MEFLSDEGRSVVVGDVRAQMNGPLCRVGWPVNLGWQVERSEPRFRLPGYAGMHTTRRRDSLG